MKSIFTRKKNPSDLSDEELVKLITSGKSDYFSILYDRYIDKVFGKVISMVGDPDESKDVTHDILIKVYLKLATFKFNSSLSTWIYRITYNFCLDFLSKKKKGPLSEQEISNKDWDKEEEIDENELLSIKVERLKKILTKISPEDKAILLMKYQEDYQIIEISEILNISESAVKMRLKRAKAKAVEINSKLSEI